MPGYQPPLNVHPVWWNGTNVNTFDPGTNVGIQLQSIFGWDDRVEVRDVREMRHSQDGEHADNVFLGGRTITLEGIVFGSTWANLQVRKRALAALFTPQTEEALFKVPEPDAVAPTGVYATTGMTDYERVSARVVESIVFGDLHGPAAQAFQVILRASDPRVYSDVETSGDSGTTGTASRTVVVDQGGTYETPPTLTVTGPTASTWTVIDSQSELSLSVAGLALASGESFEIDAQDRTVTWNALYYRPRTLRSDLVAGWMLNETSGTVADNIQGTATYDLSINGGFTLNQAGPKTGVASILLNGSTGYLSKAYVAALNPASMTWEGWVKPSSATQMPVSSYTATTGYALYLSKTNVTLYHGNGVSLTILSAAISVSSWVHVAFTITTGAARLYINGALVDSDSAVFTVNSTAALNLGRNVATSSDYLAGNLGPTFLYSSVLSASQIADLYNATDAIAASNGYQYLVASSSRWANLGTGSTTYTLSSSGLNTGSALNLTHRDARI